MQSIHLSKRLSGVASLIPTCKCLADIGSDHAHLPCFAINERIVQKAVAGEVREGPYQQALNNVKDKGMSHLVDVRLGDGLDVIEKGEADAIVIAGMGGELIADILERGLSKLTDQTKLILQPNIREWRCRLWLEAHDYRITEEVIVEESPHFYEIMKADKYPSPSPLTDEERLMGPILLRQQSPVFQKKWLLRKKNWQTVLRSLDRAEPTTDTRKKKETLQKQIDMISSMVKNNMTH